MDKTDLKEHYRKDIQFHLRCAKESVEKLDGELDPKNVEDVGEIEGLMELRYHIDEVTE